MNNNIRNILKNVGQNTYAQQLANEVKKLSDLADNNIDFIEEEVYRYLSFDYDAIQNGKKYDDYCTMSREVTTTTYNIEEYPIDMNEVVSEYNRHHQDNIVFYRGNIPFKDKPLEERFRNTGIFVSVGSFSISASIRVDKFRELINRIQNEDNGTKKR